MDDFMFSDREITEIINKICTYSPYPIDQKLGMITSKKAKKEVRQKWKSNIRALFTPILGGIAECHQNFSNELTALIVNQEKSLTKKFIEHLEDLQNNKDQDDNSQKLTHDILSVIPKELWTEIKIIIENYRDNRIPPDETHIRAYDDDCYGYDLEIKIHWKDYERPLLKINIQCEYDLDGNDPEFYMDDQIQDPDFILRVYYSTPEFIEYQHDFLHKKIDRDTYNSVTAQKEDDTLIPVTEWILKTITKIDPNIKYEKAFDSDMFKCLNAQIYSLLT